MIWLIVRTVKNPNLDRGIKVGRLANICLMFLRFRFIGL